jgi:hypothetical protein
MRQDNQRTELYPAIQADRVILPRLVEENYPATQAGRGILPRLVEVYYPGW